MHIIDTLPFMDNCCFEDDAALIRSCVARDPSAWDIFVKKYSPYIITSIRFRLRKYGIDPQADDIDEIRQNTLIRLWEGGKFADIRNPAIIKYWLAIVSGNTALQYMRKRARIKRLAPVSLSETISGVKLADMIPSGAPMPSDELDRSDLSERLRQVIESLPEKEKLAVKLHLFYEKKYEEISAIMSVPMSTVSSYIKRAKMRLRKALGEYR